MVDERSELHADTDSARAGSTPHIVRWVLAISLFAAIALLSIIWITGAASQKTEEQYVEVSERDRALAEESRRGEDTDSIVGENADEIDGAEPAAADVAQPTVENEN